MKIIEVNGIGKKFGNTEVIRDLSFEVKEGGSVVIVGPSGSGKTTILRIIAGLETPDAGEVYIDGRLASKPGYTLPPNKRKLGFIFQMPALWPHMTVEQNILFGLKGMDKDTSIRRLEEIMDKTFIKHLKGRYPDEISGGEARRVSIARSLAPYPHYLLMDEPLTNLDTGLKDKLLDFIVNTVKAAGTSLIYVTHDMKEAERITDNRVVLDTERWGSEHD